MLKILVIIHTVVPIRSTIKNTDRVNETSIVLPRNTIARDVYVTHLTAAMGEDSSRDVQRMREGRLRQGQKEARVASEGDENSGERGGNGVGRRESRAVRGRDVLGWPPS